jgi:MFS family permease
MTDSPTPTPESGPSSKSSRPSIRLIISYTCVSTIGWLAYYAQTQMYRSIMDAFDKREGAIGLLFTVENWALVIAMALVAGPLTRWSRVKVAVVGSLIFMIGNCASAFLANLGTEYFYTGISNFDLLMATRILVAVGGGVMVASAIAAVASAPHPERIFAITMITYNIVSNAESPLLPAVLIPYGATGGYLFLAGSAVLLFPFYFWLLPPKINEKAEKTEKENVWLSVKSAPNRRLALTAMAALFIYEIGQGGVNIVLGLIGEDAGLDETTLGWVFFWGVNVGLLAGLVPTWMGDRYGYLRPLVIGIILVVATGAWFAICDDGTEFAITYTLWSAAYYFVTPYVMASMARLDDLGRWVVTMEAAWTAGDAIGPWTAGELVEFGGYLYVGGLVLVTGMIGLVVIVSVGRRLDARTAASSAGVAATAS